jgi:ankyrin repeat protein
MSMASLDRPRKSIWFSGLLCFVPAAVVFTAAGMLHHPSQVALLLLADALTMTAICQVLGLARERTFSANILRRGSAYALLLTGYAAVVALLISYPLWWLESDPTLSATIALTTTVVAAVLLPWRLWPAFGLVFAWKRKWRKLDSILSLSVAFARKLTANNDLFFTHGLVVGLCLFALVTGAVGLAGIYAVLPEQIRILALAGYALLLAPLAQLLIINRCVTALLLERRREHGDALPEDLAPEEAEVSEAKPEPPVQLPATLAPPDLDAMLLRSVRAGQTDLALAALARGADANAVPPATDRDQRSVLALATLNPDMRLLRGLIARGADLNRAHADLPPLIAATRDSHQGRPDAVMTLLTNGADPRCVDAAGNTPLHYAVLSELPIVAALLRDATAPLDPVNRDGLTPLGMACAAANWNLVRFLLERGAKPECDRAQPALLCAAGISDDDPTGIELLLKRKTSVDSRDSLGRTALMVAALQGHTGIAATLLDAGAQVGLADTRGTTALMEATRSGSEEVLRLIAERDSALDVVDASGRSALIIACQSRQACEASVRHLLLVGASRDLAASDGRRAVDFAAAAGRWNIVALLDPEYPLPANMADPAPAEVDPQSPMHLLDALRFEHWNIVENFSTAMRDWTADQRLQLFVELAEHESPASRSWLLSHGLQVDALTPHAAGMFTNLFGRLPATTVALLEWHAAGASAAGGNGVMRLSDALAEAGAHRDALERLALAMIENGAEIFAGDRERRSPLAHAVASGSVLLVQALLDRGVDPNSSDRQGRSALFDALALSADSALTMTRALLRAGADPELTSASGESPLGLALARPESELRKLLNWPQWKLPRRGVRAEDLSAAAAVGDTDAVEKLLGLGISIHAVDSQGATALLRACGCGHAALVGRLLELGADPEQKAPSGATPLSAAVTARRDAVVAMLLKRGLPVDQRLPAGGTALMIASALGFPEIVALLLEHGAQTNAQDERGTHALHAVGQFAFRSTETARAQRIIELLLKHGADVNATNAAGQTPLLLLLGARAEAGTTADQKHLLVLLRQLLGAGADVNVQDQRGVSALHACAMHGLLLPARVLLSARADTSRRDVLDRSAREVAHLLGYIDVDAEIRSREADSFPLRNVE